MVKTAFEAQNENKDWQKEKEKENKKKRKTRKNTLAPKRHFQFPSFVLAKKRQRHKCNKIVKHQNKENKENHR